VPYRAQKLRAPKTPRPLLKGSHVVMALIAIVCTACLGAMFFVHR
jgi:hypothetical protein